jgi:hypothetical protein
VEKLLEQFNEVIESLFSKGSRHQPEKIATIAAYALVAIASAVWAFSGTDSDNELGAEFDIKHLHEIDDQNFFLRNTGSTTWTGVRVVLNEKYLWTTDKVDAGAQRTLRPSNFEYYYYIPRPWGRRSWEQLSKQDKPEKVAPPLVKIDLVQIRAKQGRLDIEIGPDGEPKKKGKGSTTAVQ